MKENVIFVISHYSHLELTANLKMQKRIWDFLSEVLSHFAIVSRSYVSDIEKQNSYMDTI